MNSKIFKYSINFPFTIIYKIERKVIFLTNSILYIKDIINDSLGVIINILENENIKTAFLIKNNIEMRINSQDLFIVRYNKIVNIYIIILIL